jgi:hypothetical protein
MNRLEFLKSLGLTAVVPLLTPWSLAARVTDQVELPDITDFIDEDELKKLGTWLGENSKAGVATEQLRLVLEDQAEGENSSLTVWQTHMLCYYYYQARKARGLIT